jgi:hypothetical protein
VNETTDDVKVLPDQKEISYYVNVYRSSLYLVPNPPKGSAHGDLPFSGAILRWPPHWGNYAFAVFRAAFATLRL